MFSKGKRGDEKGKISTKSDYVMRDCSLFQTIETFAISKLLFDFFHLMNSTGQT